MAETKTAAINTLGAGSIFNYGGIRWILLEHARNAALCLAADLLPDEKPFDAEGNNDWAGSSLRAYLNGDFMKELVAAVADADAFVEMVVDLTSDDGLDDYGTDRCKIALISDAQYRRFRKIIHNANNWWWTITPFSTAKNGYSRRAPGPHLRRVEPQPRVGRLLWRAPALQSQIFYHGIFRSGGSNQPHRERGAR